MTIIRLTENTLFNMGNVGALKPTDIAGSNHDADYETLKDPEM